MRLFELYLIFCSSTRTGWFYFWLLIFNSCLLH